MLALEIVVCLLLCMAAVIEKECSPAEGVKIFLSAFRGFTCRNTIKTQAVKLPTHGD